jgi:hypothetical protein
LRVLRGDFFCAPFGDSDLTIEETRLHGATANGPWHKISSSERHIELELDQKILGATVRKRIGIEPGHAVVYQQHDFIGGSGRLPLGHHAMLCVPERVYLGFSPWLWGGTPPWALPRTPAARRVHLVAHQRDRFGSVQAQSLVERRPRELGGGEDAKAFLLDRGEVHLFLLRRAYPRSR